MRWRRCQNLELVSVGEEQATNRHDGPDARLVKLALVEDVDQILPLREVGQVVLEDIRLSDICEVGIAVVEGAVRSLEDEPYATAKRGQSGSGDKYQRAAFVDQRLGAEEVDGMLHNGGAGVDDEHLAGRGTRRNDRNERDVYPGIAPRQDCAVPGKHPAVSRQRFSLCPPPDYGRRNEDKRSLDPRLNGQDAAAPSLWPRWRLREDL